MANHVHNLVSVDLFTVPTATFRLFFVFIVLAYQRRSVPYFNVTEQPTAAWTAQQIVEVFPSGCSNDYEERAGKGAALPFLAPPSGFSRRRYRVIVTFRHGWDSQLLSAMPLGIAGSSFQ